MKYILNYYDMAGRAEPIRLMFQVAGIEFEDNRMSRDEWTKAKTDVKIYPLGQNPTLQVDDKVICQSNAIFRYLATEFGLYGEDVMERTVIDQVMETLSDFIEGIIVPIMCGGYDDETKKAKYAEKFGADLYKRQMTFINNILKNNNSGNGFLVGDKISMADITFYCYGHFMLETANKSYLDDFPELVKLNERVLAVDSIKKYYDSKK